MSIIANFGNNSRIGSNDDGRITKISKLKKGDLFRKKNGKKVLIYDGKVRVYNRWGEYKGWGYSWGEWDDIGGYGETAKDIDVVVDFDF